MRGLKPLHLHLKVQENRLLQVVFNTWGVVTSHEGEEQEAEHAIDGGARDATAAMAEAAGWDGAGQGSGRKGSNDKVTDGVTEGGAEDSNRYAPLRSWSPTGGGSGDERKG